MEAVKQQNKKDLFFSEYKVVCHLKSGTKAEPLIIELSPFAVLIAASAVQMSARYSIESCFADAMVHVLRSITDQFTIINIETQ